LAINQELADEGLSKMARPAGGGSEKTELAEFAKMQADINKEK